ncbi:hypothetical protein FJT64_002804 [Amphibalanus amphitrite]|uniref:Retrotransposon gag domain-containing protein n=1 Tax=Amphibalanus amphitrite TaxID=1232801 RepID=A0A6A4WK08_AMPAM|nr:hypothetical protein FJT64_002804 [Amphibalanus amphitrite]
MDTPTETGAVVQGSEQVRIGAGLDPRLIDEYDGSGDVVEWHTQASLLCEYRGVSAAEVLPMRLKGGAFAVWSQLSAVDRRSATATRDALFKAFAMDDFAAHTAFVARRLEPGESADVFLASLRRYAALFGGVTDRQLVVAFVNGLPASVADTIRAGTSGTAKVTMECQGKRVTLAAFVVPDRPLGVDMVLGMSGITALGGISLRTPTDVRICAAAAAEVDPQGLALDAADFSARFEAQTGEWTVAWKSGSKHRTQSLPHGRWLPRQSRTHGRMSTPHGYAPCTRVLDIRESVGPSAALLQQVSSSALATTSR